MGKVKKAKKKCCGKLRKKGKCCSRCPIRIKLQGFPEFDKQGKGKKKKAGKKSSKEK